LVSLIMTEVSSHNVGSAGFSHITFGGRSIKRSLSQCIPQLRINASARAAETAMSEASVS
jgi:hypothetical protein